MVITCNRRGTQFVAVHRVPEVVMESGRFSPLPFCFVVALHAGGALLVHHRRRGSWETPGGRLEPGEMPRQCALRELREETGQPAAGLEFEAVLEFRGPPRGGTFYGALFSARLAELVPFAANDEIDRICLWDGRADIGYMDEIDRVVVGRALAGRL